MKSILDKDFKYTPSYATDLSERVRKHLREVRKLQRQDALERAEKVIPLATMTVNDRATVASGDATVAAGVQPQRKKA